MGSQEEESPSTIPQDLWVGQEASQARELRPEEERGADLAATKPRARAAEEQGSSEQASQIQEPDDNEELWGQMNRLSSFWEAKRLQRPLSGEARTLIQASWRPGTESSYGSCWR